MRKTLVVGFIGIFMVGGFLAGLYLVNKPTNPASSASTEIVNPVQPPEEATSGANTSGGLTLAKCEKLYGRVTTDADFDAKCDLDNNGIINVLDLQKMK